MISRTVAIGSSVGLHARPASVLAEAVDDSGVEVTIAFDGEEADAASLLCQRRNEKDQCRHRT